MDDVGSGDVGKTVAISSLVRVKEDCGCPFDVERSDWS
jgi:hypothetical protein